VRRFLPAVASREEVIIATIWLTQQVAPFIRHYDTLSQPPLNLRLDHHFTERLVTDISRMAIAGLASRRELKPA